MRSRASAAAARSSLSFEFVAYPLAHHADEHPGGLAERLLAGLRRGETERPVETVVDDHLAADVGAELEGLVGGVLLPPGGDGVLDCE
ncbi:hypothetical protein BRC63_06335 [Halobacteriales archaeon QH_10_70_21]|nr:MAG: hypothetical protein BRC63_06335 [Halobacteriales archaeon QH_10_70_21]